MIDYEWNLKAEIADRSIVPDPDAWTEAKAQWEFDRFYRRSGSPCCCGYPRLTNVFVLRNEKSGRTADVGRVCLLYFLDLPEKILQGMVRIGRQSDEAPMLSLVKHSRIRGWIASDEYRFHLRTARLGDLSRDELVARRQINEKIIDTALSRRFSPAIAEHLQCSRSTNSK